MNGKLKLLIPSIATLGNLTAGVLALMFVSLERIELAALMVLVSILFDSFDGALARRLNAVTRFGSELDSLADMVSFGVVPAMLLFSVLPDRLLVPGYVTGVLYAVSSACRLARYNIRGRPDIEVQGFIGLPTTGAGGCVAGAIILHEMFAVGGLMPVFSPLFLLCLLFILSFLMVSHIHYLHAGTLLGRIPRSLLTGGTAALVSVTLLWGYEALFFIFFSVYVLSGPFLAVAVKVKEHRRALDG